MSYECHITVTVADAVKAEKIAAERGWKTSEIKRDPVLGDGSHFYLTAHHAEYAVLLARMLQAAKELREAGCTVLREKIEHIVYDTKTGIGLKPPESSKCIISEISSRVCQLGTKSCVAKHSDAELQTPTK